MGAPAGLDYLYGDTATLAVLSSHANAGMFRYAYAHMGPDGVNQCTVYLNGNARLGQMAGAQTSHAIYYGCCVLRLDSLVNYANLQWVNQAFGFIDDEWNTADELQEFLVFTGPLSNVNAWLMIIEYNPGWFSGSNSPIVVSYGQWPEATEEMHCCSQIAYGINMGYRTGGPSCGNGPPSFYYMYTYIDNDNGCG